MRYVGIGSGWEAVAKTIMATGDAGIAVIKRDGGGFEMHLKDAQELIQKRPHSLNAQAIRDVLAEMTDAGPALQPN